MTAYRRRPPGLALTRDMIARAFPGPLPEDGPAMLHRSDGELADGLAATMAEGQVGDGDLWLFAYGSLMWKPEPEIADAERRVAVVAGWHRRFCLWQWRYRGSQDQPGLMLALDRGGACAGVALRVAGPGAVAKVASVWRREMIANGYRARWVVARLARDQVSRPLPPVRALTFVVNRDGGRYAGRLDDTTIAAHIAAACGQRGPSAEYLLETVAHCAELGIHDRHLWRIQKLVAERMGGGLPYISAR
jgi:cation transport protein ChaC